MAKHNRRLCNFLAAWPSALKQAAGLVLTGAICTAAAQDQNAVGAAYLRGKAPIAPDAISALGTELFGDKINLYNGALSFEHTDTELPGNSALRVALIRQHAPGRQTMVRGALGDWDLGTPRIEGSFADAEGWVPYNGTVAQRCSSFNMPPYVTRGGFGPHDFTPDDYWQGTYLAVPGHGSQEILANSLLPTQAGQWPLATRDNWQVGCLPSVQNAPGQGFVARSPEGVTYRFDWMAKRLVPPLRMGDVVLGRNEMFLMATLVTDRFGNWVRYHYNPASPLLLERIEASDGRIINLQYMAGRVSSVFDGTRTWTYQYNAQGDLHHVVLPDASRWTFSLRSLIVHSDTMFNENQPHCDAWPPVLDYPTSGWMTHPSGAAGTFYTNFLMQPRTNVERICTYYSGGQGSYTNGSVHAHTIVNQALERKVIQGPGMPTMEWRYQTEGNPIGEWAPCGACPDSKTVKVTEPSGAITLHTFGIGWRRNEGQLLRVEQADSAGNLLRTTDNRYRTATGQPYPDGYGTSVRYTTDLVSSRNRPQNLRKIVQQGVHFNWEAGAFDFYTRHLLTTASSSQGNSRAQLYEYLDFPDMWLMGQLRRVVETRTGAEVERTDFNGAAGMPSAKYSFGRLVQRMDYSPLGTLSNLIDAAGNATRFENYHRGQPQRAWFADGTTATQVINNLGRAASYTNEAGSSTAFQFDAMGRVARIIYPSGDDEPYCDILQSFEQIWVSDRGLAPGHWRQSVRTCNAITERWFDALWRMRLQRRHDAADPAGTGMTVESRFDSGGHKAFDSYALRDIPQVDSLSTTGTQFEYDALNRIVRSHASSELGLLTTFTAHLGNFTKRVTDPRGQVTSYFYQLFDEPSEDAIASIDLPEAVQIAMERDVFGKALSITRSGPSSSGPTSATRSYSYDAHQRLCKTFEPETGATLQGYDMAGNVAWRVSGQPAGIQCTSQPPLTAKVSFIHDQRNRLVNTRFDDNQPSIWRSYTSDGLLQQVVSGSFTWTYGYNNRRLLKQEALSVPAQTPGQGWNFTRFIDKNGHTASLTDYWGTMHRAPDALGRPRQVSGYVSEVTYHPNGMVAGYTLANGISRRVTQSPRGLPREWQDMGVMWDVYSHDRNGNTESIQDWQWGESRNMAYDGLDRLRTANGIWGAAHFGYDALDNLRSSQVGGRHLSHHVDSASNRLTSLSGSLNLAMGYDANGNVTQRGTQSYSFDIGNRMRAVPGKVNWYDYDGHGRRGWVVWADGSTQLNAYGFANASGSTGQLLFSAHSGKGATRYVYLGDKLIAEHNNQTGVSYVHTDALGSPVARTNAAGQTLGTRTRYEPYGATAAGDNPQGIGFTGHVNDADTGLVYMQQRYYDPLAGRFLSVDPVVTDQKTGDHFNRYEYAESNPYKFKDPDGRAPQLIEESKNAGRPMAGMGQTNSDGGPVRLGTRAERVEAIQASREARGLTPSPPGPAVDKATGQTVGRIAVDSKGNAMIEPAGGKTVPTGKGGVDTHTLNPNGSNYQRLNPQGHGNNPTPHGHGHLPGSGPGKAGQGPSIDPKGNVVPANSPAAHWPIKEK